MEDAGRNLKSSCERRDLLRKLCAAAGWRKPGALASEKGRAQDEGNAGKVASRVVSVGDDVVGCGGGAVVAFLAKWETHSAAISCWQVANVP